MKWIDKLKSWAALGKNIWRDRKTHTYFKCANCKAVIRVPKRKGGGIVTCPKCRARRMVGGKKK